MAAVEIAPAARPGLLHVHPTPTFRAGPRPCPPATPDGRRWPASQRHVSLRLRAMALCRPMSIGTKIKVSFMRHQSARSPPYPRLLTRSNKFALNGKGPAQPRLSPKAILCPWLGATRIPKPSPGPWPYALQTDSTNRQSPHILGSSIKTRLNVDRNIGKRLGLYVMPFKLKPEFNSFESALLDLHASLVFIFIKFPDGSRTLGPLRRHISLPENIINHRRTIVRQVRFVST